MGEITGEGLFEVEEKTFMGGVQIDGLQLTCGVGTDSTHEAKGFGDRRDHTLVLCFDRR